MAEVISGKTVQKEDKVSTTFMSKRQLSDVIKKAGSVSVKTKEEEVPSAKPIGHIITDPPKQYVDTRHQPSAVAAGDVLIDCDICKNGVPKKNIKRHMQVHKNVEELHPQYVALIPLDKQWTCDKCGLIFHIGGKGGHSQACDGTPWGLRNRQEYESRIERLKNNREWATSDQNLKNLEKARSHVGTTKCECGRTISNNALHFHKKVCDVHNQTEAEKEVEEVVEKTKEEVSVDTPGGIFKINDSFMKLVLEFADIKTPEDLDEVKDFAARGVSLVSKLNK